jgi:ACT domain-containing protein
MKTLILIASLMFTLSGFANTCVDDPQDTVAKKISEQLPKQDELKSYQSVRSNYSLLLDHKEAIKSIVVNRSQYRADAVIVVKFNDGSDARIHFNKIELGSRLIGNVYQVLKNVTRSNRNSMTINQKQLNAIMNSRTVLALTAKADYSDAETEIGSSEFQSCTLDLEVRARGAKVDQFSGGLF